jgi:hypothetical protein
MADTVDCRIELDLGQGEAFQADAFQSDAFQFGGYVDVTDDVDGDEGVDIDYGIQGNSPLDRVAGAGSLKFALSNHERRYSPHHPDCRTGFGFGIGVRVYLEAEGVPQVLKFVGTVYEIDAEPGLRGRQITVITAYDYMYELDTKTVRSIAPQINKSEDELIQAVLDAMPVAPPAVDLNAGIDQYPFAFDNIAGGVAARGAIAKANTSAWGKVFVKGDGTVCYRTRLVEQQTAPMYLFTDDDLAGVAAPTTLEQVYDYIRATVHPKELGATDTEVLFTATNIVEIAPGATVTQWVTYSDPNNRKTKIGGTDFQAPLANTDYKANSAPDGSGADITADISIVQSAFVSSCKREITNANVATAYLVTPAGAPLLQLRGRGVYDLAPQTYEYISGDGNRPLREIDLEYQDDGNIAQALVNLIGAQYDPTTARKQVKEFSFNPHLSPELMAQAINGEPCDAVMVSESVTALDEVPVLIHRIRLRIMAGPQMTCVYSVAQKLVGDLWLLDDAVLSELDATTILSHG